ncbi:hypothetical protein [Streptomyces sp. NPDC002952]|uniref:hypothetical protein n=1 Tax=Streptomyces sp. NPDC002952 TaxID=3364673 RepID=UPI0036C2F0F3
MSMDDRPEALDALLAHVADNLPDEATTTAKARAALAPLEAKVRALKAREHAEIRSAARAEAAAELRTDASLRDAEGEIALAAYGRELADLLAPSTATEGQPKIVRGVDQAQAVEPNPPVDVRADPGIDRVPVTRSVRYIVRGAPDVPDEYNATRTVAPTEVTLTYRVTPDSQLGRVHAYVKGWWMQDGARIHSESVGRHFTGDLTNWPKWLAAEARHHDADGAS